MNSKISILEIPEIVKRKKILYETIAVFTIVFFTTIGASLKIPLHFTPVPITLQVFFVLLGAALVEPKLSTLSQMFYIILGTSGFPLFAGGKSGFAYLAGPTGGYIIGFLLSSFVVGMLIKVFFRPKENFYDFLNNSVYSKDNFLPIPKFIENFFKIFLIMVLGVLTIYIPGVLHLMSIIGGGFRRAWLLGAAPFVFIDFGKALFASLLFLGIKGKIGILDFRF